MTTTKGVDRITVQVVREYLDSLAKEMSSIVERSAMHPLFNEVHDYSTGIFYYDRERVHLISMSLETAVPNHIIASMLSVEAMMESHGEGLAERDVIVLNDPYFGGTHNADWTLMTPVFLESGSIIVPSVRAHMADSGGPMASSYNPEAREVWQEAFRLTPLKLVEAGEVNSDVMRLVLRNTRIPDVLEGDLGAILGACGVAREKTEQLKAKYGDELVEHSMISAMDYAERRFRAEVESWPDGVYDGESILDHDSAGARDLAVRCAMTVAGDSLKLDFTGSAPQSQGNVNSPLGNTASTAYASLCTAISEDIPVNSGLFRAVEIVAPEGSIVNPIPPVPVMMATCHVNSEIGTSVMKAMEHVVPESCGAVANGGALCTMYGWDERFDEFFVTIEFGCFLVNAGGAKGTDGWGGWPSPSSAIRFSTIEMLELQFPFVYEEWEFATDTAAPGQWRGLPALSMRREAVSDQYTNIWLGGVRNPPPGWQGGAEGIPNWIKLEDGAADERQVDETVTAALLPKGSVMSSIKGGGGGWGDPLDRDPAAVLTDVKDEIYTQEYAQETFAVVLNGTPLGVDEDATRALREQRRADQKEER